MTQKHRTKEIDTQRSVQNKGKRRQEIERFTRPRQPCMRRDSFCVCVCAAAVSEIEGKTRKINSDRAIKITTMNDRHIIATIIYTYTHNKQI